MRLVAGAEGDETDAASNVSAVVATIASTGCFELLRIPVLRGF